ncbi:MAG: GAF domain-containing protein [Anaerolineales bacterium]|nr:MAG: GAF domain-containing protein [Anaerolineales bacterium]
MPGQLNVTQHQAKPDPWSKTVKVLLISAFALAIVVSLIAPWLAWRWTRAPFMGVLLEHTMVVSDMYGQGWSGRLAGLTSPDRILEVNGQAMPNAAELRRVLEAARPGNQVTLTVEGQDEGGWSQRQVNVTLTGFPSRDFISFFWLPYFLGLVYLALGLWVYYLKGNTRGGQSFGFFCAWSAIFTASFFDLVTTHRLVPLWTFSLPLIAASMAHLGLVFPAETTLIRRYPPLRLLPYLPALALAAWAEYALFDPRDPRAYFIPWRWNFAYVGLGLLIFFALLLYTRLRTSPGVVRYQARIILLGSIITFAPLIFWIVSAILQLKIPFQPFLYCPPLIAFPICVAYALLRYRLLDVDLVISRGLAYSILTVGVTAAYFLLIGLVGQLFAIASPASNPFILAIFVLILVVFMSPLRDRVQLLVDSVFYKDRQDYRSILQDFSRALTTILDLSHLLDVLVERVQDVLHAERAAVILLDQRTDYYISHKARGISEQVMQMIRFSEENQVVHWLSERGPLYLHGEEGDWYPDGFSVEEKARLEALGVVLCIPLQTREQLIGWLALGPKLSGDLYSRDDLAFLSALADQTSLVIQGARLHEETQQKVRELSLLFRASTAISSSLEIGEVWSALAQRMAQIVDATSVHVYECSLDERTSSVIAEFAGHRASEKERVSHIGETFPLGECPITKGALRAHRPLGIGLSDPTTGEGDRARLLRLGGRTALIIPLMVRDRVIGFVDLCESRRDRQFTEGEIRLCQTVANQAIITVEKAGLFQEERKRALQLETVREVSQKIVSILNLDELLAQVVELIQQRFGYYHVQVFLNNPDNQWTVFRAGTGRTGEVMVKGSHQLKIGEEGIVGWVASSGEFLLSNDVSKEPHFLPHPALPDTKAELAIPLPLGERILGILDVQSERVNAFEESDLFVLQSLADQVAIAIENARLYTMTDQALAKRLEELAIMQEIDRQLNATLDYDRVMDFTLDCAIQMTGADGGIISIVDQEQRAMLFLATQGHPLEDESFRRQSWPLNQGIVGRVVRTRQPVLVSDVTQDPDYVSAISETRSQLTVPILREGRVMGVISVEGSKLAAFDGDDLIFMTRLADHAAIAIENARLYSDLKQANEAKSEFVSIVSHELKTPMTSIKGYADLLFKGAAGGISEMQQKFLQVIRSNVDRMNVLVSDLLDISRIESGRLKLHIQSISVKAVVDEVIQTMQEGIKAKELALTVEVPEDLPPVRADGDHLIRVLTNLMSNAYRYTLPGGKIGVKATVWPNGPPPGKAKPVPPGEQHLWYLCLSVSDTGIGISPQDQTRIFDKFFRGDDPVVRESTGAGLGLSIAKSIVELHDGQMWFQSEPGQGSTFSFTVPIASDN